ncbi:MAG: archaellin/type IV pilin N-terminal domain-containing protein [Candidatus Hodarchaeota archaeon]
MKSFIRFVNKKRAISPVIAVILLIGLAVAAAAAIFLIVLPLFAPSSNLQMDDAYVVYDDEYTTAADLGEGYGKGTLVLSNTGTADIDIVSLKVYYASGVLGPWTEITSHDGLLITESNPYTIETLSSLEELSVRFLIPDENDDNTVFYRIIITTDDGEELDTATAETVDETEMDLAKDRPDISYLGSSLGFLRREEPIRPSQISDNSKIKNVTYEVFFTNGTPVFDKVILPPNTLWQWTWDTRIGTTEGLDNGTYNMRMTVYDYAGLSDETDDLIPFTIDNDYEDPVIQSVTATSEAEVGQSYQITANITDSGSLVSDVLAAYVHYKLNDSSTTYFTASMSNPADDELWVGNVPATFLGHDSLLNNITYYVTAIDDDTNDDTSSDYFAGVVDTVEPNIVLHTFNGETVISQTEFDAPESQGINILVTVTDADFVSDVVLFWRETNDTTILDADPWQEYGNVSGTGETWEFYIPSPYITLDGLEYYINATDNSGNFALDGDDLAPYEVNVADEITPTLVVTSDVPSQLTEGESISITAIVSDNDPSFSYWGNERGAMELGYKRSTDSVYSYVSMIHESGDSSQGELAIWEGTLSGSIFQQLGSPVTVRVRATDPASQVAIEDYSVEVLAAGVPVIQYVTDSVLVTGTDDHVLRFTINNSAGGAQAATATFTDLKISLYNKTKVDAVGTPRAVEINASASVGNPVWTNDTATEGNNDSIITLDSTFDLTKGSTSVIWVTYANSSGGNYDVNDLTILVTVYYNYGVSSSDSQQLDSFDTPTTTIIPTTETRYLRQDYTLGLTQTSTQEEVQSARYWGSQTITWGIRVYIRHQDTSLTELTLGVPAATVTRSSGEGMQSATWDCPQTVVDPTDRIMIEVYIQVGGNSPERVATLFSEELSAVRLKSSTWTIWYYTRHQYSGFRTRGYFSFGDPTHDSRILNIQYDKQPS